jgi:HAD superfamily hydrolase (TIGR01490 family)
VLFDFDETITTTDTLFSFTRFAVGNFKFYLGLIVIAIPLLLHILRVVSAHDAKEIFLKYFFKNFEQERFSELCELFCSETLPKIIRPGIIDIIQNHKNQNSHLVIVSASPENWIVPWARKFEIDVIATKLEIKEGRLTGNIDGKNCNGTQKVIRIKEKIQLEKYTEIIAYGNSRADLPMMSLAQMRYYNVFTVS